MLQLYVDEIACQDPDGAQRMQKKLKAFTRMEPETKPKKKEKRREEDETEAEEE